MNWLKRNASALEAVAAVIMAAAAVAALIGVKLQLEAADHLQRAQSARDAYRAHLALAVAHPDFAAPPDECAMLASPRGDAYAAFVDHLLYSAEQMVTVEAGWERSFRAELQPHAAYLCSSQALDAPQGPLRDLLSDFEQAHCAETPVCAE